jgi:transposase
VGTAVERGEITTSMSSSYIAIVRYVRSPSYAPSAVTRTTGRSIWSSNAATWDGSSQCPYRSAWLRRRQEDQRPETARSGRYAGIGAACHRHRRHIQDRDGGAWLLGTLFGPYPFLLKLYADGGYQGPEFRTSVKAVLSQVQVEIVKCSHQVKGFVVLPKRWVVERTLAWLSRCRRLSKDWQNLNHKAQAFLLMASIRLMVRRLSRA